MTLPVSLLDAFTDPGLPVDREIRVIYTTCRFGCKLFARRRDAMADVAWGLFVGTVPAQGPDRVPHPDPIGAERARQIAAVLTTRRCLAYRKQLDRLRPA